VSKRLSWLKIRVSDEDLQQLRERARLEGYVNLSDYVRKRLGLPLSGRRVRKIVAGSD